MIIEQHLHELTIAFRKMEKIAEKMESELKAIGNDHPDLKPDGQEFIKEMTYCHADMRITINLHEPAVCEAESVLGIKPIGFEVKESSAAGLEACGATI